MEKPQEKTVRTRMTDNVLAPYVPSIHVIVCPTSYNIVVTQRAKKGMTNAEAAAQTKLNLRVKFENAKAHRKVRQERRLRYALVWFKLKFNY